MPNELLKRFKDRWVNHYAEVLRLSGEYSDGDEPWNDIKFIEDIGGGSYVIHTGDSDHSWRAVMRFCVENDCIVDIAEPKKEVYDAKQNKWNESVPDEALYNEFDILISEVAICELVRDERS